MSEVDVEVSECILDFIDLFFPRLSKPNSFL